MFDVEEKCSNKDYCPGRRFVNLNHCLPKSVFVNKAHLVQCNISTIITE